MSEFFEKAIDKYHIMCYNDNVTEDNPIVTPPTVSPISNTTVRLTARKDGNKLLYYFYRGENFMNTVEIVVLFEDCRRKQEEENKRAEEIRIVSKIEQLQEMEELIAEAKAEAEKIKDEIKNEMMKRNTEELRAGKYIIRWTEVLSQRFDTTAFKKLFPEVYQSFTKSVSSRRFSVSG